MIVGVGYDIAKSRAIVSTPLSWRGLRARSTPAGEMAYAMRKRNWPERLAGFFAAKEATRKAFGHAIPWRWVGVAHERSGKPTIELRERAEPLCARARRARDPSHHHAHGATAAAALVILES